MAPHRTLAYLDLLLQLLLLPMDGFDASNGPAI